MTQSSYQSPVFSYWLLATGNWLLSATRFQSLLQITLLRRIGDERERVAVSRGRFRPAPEPPEHVGL